MALTGLCEGLKNIMDDFFVFDIETGGNNKAGLVFLGVKKSRMIFNQQTKRWNIISLLDESVIMELYTEVS